VSCGDGGSFAAKFSAITRIMLKYLHLWKYDAPCYKFSSKPHPTTAWLAWSVICSHWHGCAGKTTGIEHEAFGEAAGIEHTD
jgi:hypothetical protein